MTLIKNGLERRDEAIARAEARADALWKRLAMRAVTKVATTLDTFTTDEVWELLNDTLEVEIHDPRAIGAVMREAGRQKMIVSLDQYRISSRPQCHGRPVRVWKSLMDNKS